MKVLKIIAILLLVGGIILTGLSAYTYFNNEDRARAEQLSAEQTRILTEASQARGTPRERELMKEYEEGKGVTELAWEHARQTDQTVLLAALGGLALIIAPVLMLVISRKKTRPLSV